MSKKIKSIIIQIFFLKNTYEFFFMLYLLKKNSDLLFLKIKIKIK